MRKVVIFILVFITSKSLICQSKEQLFVNSLQTNKQNYINQPFSKLLGDFVLPIKGYIDALPLPSYPDTIQVRRLSFDFFEAKDITNFYLSGKREGPSIYIEFVYHVRTPKVFLRRGRLLDVTTPWDSAKANYYGSALVKDFRIVQ